MAGGARLSLLDLLLLPVMGPLRGVQFVLEQLRAATEKEAESTEKLQDRLLELQLAYELGEVPDEEYRRLWAEISERLVAITAAETEPGGDDEEVG